MNVDGFSLVRLSDGAIVMQGVSVPGRIEIFDDAGVCLLRVDGAKVGWSNDDYRIDYAVIVEPDPIVPVPAVISDRQFFQQLALIGIISQDEALAAVGPGTIPAKLAGLIQQLPADQQFSASMLVRGSVEFHRSHPLVSVIGSAFGWTSDQLDAFWRAAAIL